MIAVACLSVLLAGALVLLYIREQAHDTERRHLLDRIQAPDAGQMHAYSTLAPRPEPKTPPEPTGEPVRFDGDLRLDDFMELNR